MDSMVERVARAMAVADSGPEGSSLFDIHWREFGPGYRDSATTAIKAMREPTEAMLFAADWLENGTRAAWQAMVDAALAPTQE